MLNYGSVEGGIHINTQLFAISDFARITNTTLATLHHYDKLNLLSPESRGGNKYRLYSVKQIAVLNMIKTLRNLDVPLAVIKEMKDGRTPEFLVELLKQQVSVIDDKQRALESSRTLLHTLLNTIQSGLEADQGSISIQYLPAEPIILGQTNDYSGRRNAYDALISFYDSMSNRSNVDLIYPAWAVYSKETILKGDRGYPERFYLFNPDGGDHRPASLYAVGYTRGGYGQGAALYDRMLPYIEDNGFELCGDTYEEYPLNEICITDENDYLMRVMMTVREKAR
jgi:DNA-binding transcriptional MerR regulator/effector-binding domain-containing protein